MKESRSRNRSAGRPQPECGGERFGEVADRYPAARGLLRELGLDGDRESVASFAEVCRSHGLDPETLLRVLPAVAVASAPARPASVELMSLQELCDHLVNVQHRLLRRELQGIAKEITNLETPSVFAPFSELFSAFHQKLSDHLREEEELIFPLIRGLDNEETPDAGAAALLAEALGQMKREHSAVDEELAELVVRLERVSAPPSAAGEQEELFASLQRLESLLHGQVYQENQILYRRAWSRVAAA